jgi:phage terminase large subunit-like protein
MSFQPTAHPIFKLPTLEEAESLGHEKFAEIMLKREQLIAEEKHDPLRKGWETPMWKICDALLEWPWLDKDECRKIREILGFHKPVDVLLINGGNRGGKSEYAAKRTMMMLQYVKSARAWCFHESNQNSVEYQHPLMWKYLPPDQRKKTRTEVAYISYNQKYGFSDSKFVLHNHSECIFRNYEQDREKIEGGELNLAWCDELVPPDWVETLELRLATRSPLSKMLVTFTPVKGYSATCKMFQDGAEIMHEATAFLCPRDEGVELEDYALHLQDCMDWVKGGTGQLPIPSGRKFETVPRLMKSLGGDGKRAVAFFHSSDNPYGNPSAVVDFIKGKPRWYVRERFYGLANKTMASRFPKFDPKVHCIEPDDIPKEGANVLVVDPSSGRNFYMAWFRVVGERMYCYREWPSGYEIPEVGVVGPWALPDGKKPDGRQGPAQDPFGFGLWKIKREIARLEGWEDCKNYKSQPDQREGEAVKEWTEANGSDENVVLRIMDSRAASTPRVENDRPVTLITDFEDIELYFDCAPGDAIADGVAKINDALDWNEDEELSYLNSPKFYVSKNCINLIFSLQNWTGLDGNKGCCKDPIDAARYFFLSDCENISAGTWSNEGGGYYG